MRLVKLRLRNFRCYQNEYEIDFDNMTAIIGRNDSGKSTIMDALNIFLNDENPDKHDASISGAGEDLAIICEFSDLPDQAIIDEDYPTSFSQEYLLNEHGRLEIHKRYSGHTASPKCTGISAYAIHPTTENASDLLKLKNNELKKRAKELGIDLSGVDQKVNAQLRQKIRESLGDLALQPSMVQLNDDNAKKAWEGIKVYIPGFALFKSDRASTDQDSEAQDPLKVAVKEAIKQKEAELKALAAHVEGEVKRIAQATLQKLQEMDPGLAQELNPLITLKKWDTLFSVSITGDENIPINKRGSGVRRLVLLNFFRAKAELMAQENSHTTIIYGIEEPETSQHPHNQRLLVSALQSLSVDNQVILTTHTPMLARALPDASLRYIHQNEDKTRVIQRGGPETNKLFASSLGVLPDNSVRLFVGVEGPNDIAFLKQMSRMLIREDIDVLDLEAMELNGEIIFFPLGGSTLALWVSRLEPVGRPEFHLYDRDVAPPGASPYQATVDGINQRPSCKAILTKRREAENYLHYQSINEAYKAICDIDLGLSVQPADFDDVPALVAKLVHERSGSPNHWDEVTEEKRKQKISRAKKHLCENAASRMSKSWLAEIDPDGEVLGWFSTMKTLAIQ